MHRVLVLLVLSGIFSVCSSITRQYHFINAPMFWAEAQSYCRVRYTDLATVDSMNDTNTMYQMVAAGYSGTVWIGLQRATQGRWGWSNGEDTLAQYSDWSSGEPSSSNKCGYFAYGSWASTSCSTGIYFACYSATAKFIWVKANQTWYQAQSYCRQTYTDLATIHNSEEEQHFFTFIGNGSFVYIGLFLDFWQWSDQWNLFFRNWAAGQPSQGSMSDCVSISTAYLGQWNNQNCRMVRPFFCYGSPQSPPRQYQYVNKSMTWADAQTYCRWRYTDLATADSLSDVSSMLDTVDDGAESVWIGLQRGEVVRWVWTLGNWTLSQYSSWGAGEPSGAGSCVKTYSGSWYDDDCSNEFYFVCFSDMQGFVLIETLMNWIDAQSYCRQFYTDLVTITSTAQLDLINPSLTYWIGLSLSSFSWSDQWKNSFRNWWFQNAGSGDCVSMLTKNSQPAGEWQLNSCGNVLPFICYGEDRLKMKKEVVRLEFSCSGPCTLEDPAVQTNILNQVTGNLKQLGLESDSKITWSEDGEVFHLIPQSSAGSESKAGECGK